MKIKGEWVRAAAMAELDCIENSGSSFPSDDRLLEVAVAAVAPLIAEDVLMYIEKRLQERCLFWREELSKHKDEQSRACLCEAANNFAMIGIVRRELGVSIGAYGMAVLGRDWSAPVPKSDNH